MFNLVFQRFQTLMIFHFFITVLLTVYLILLVERNKINSKILDLV